MGCLGRNESDVVDLHSTCDMVMRRNKMSDNRMQSIVSSAEEGSG